MPRKVCLRLTAVSGPLCWWGSIFLSSGSSSLMCLWGKLWTLLSFQLSACAMQDITQLWGMCIVGRESRRVLAVSWLSSLWLHSSQSAVIWSREWHSDVMWCRVLCTSAMVMIDWTALQIMSLRVINSCCSRRVGSLSLYNCHPSFLLCKISLDFLGHLLPAGLSLACAVYLGI